MSEQPQPQAQPQPGASDQPLFGIEKIYMKDLSLELPNAPQVFFEREAPQIEVNIHNEATRMTQEGLYEVALTVTVTAKIQDRTVFLVEVAQAESFRFATCRRPSSTRCSAPCARIRCCRMRERRSRASWDAPVSLPSRCST